MQELIAAAEKHVRNETRRQLWLKSAHSKLRSKDGAARRPIELAAESQTGLEKALALMMSQKV